MRRGRSRALALGALAAGVAAFVLAVSTAVGGHATTLAAVKGASATATATSTSVPFADARVEVRVALTGTCFTVVDRAASAHSCAASLGSGEISYARTRGGIGGVAGADVHAVIVRLTREGTVWATLRGGAFYAAVPAGYRPRLVVKVLKDGSRRAFAVT